MQHCEITIASYDDRSAANSDWHLVECVKGANEPRVFDAALVEVDDDTVVALHRWAAASPGKGCAISGAIGLLRPSALLAGPLAGGVGANMITTINHALTSDDLRLLGDALDQRSFAIVVIATSGQNATGSTLCGRPWPHATATACVQCGLTPDDIEFALLADRAME